MTAAEQNPIVDSDGEFDDVQPINKDNPPSWFARTYGDSTPKEMADNYLSARVVPSGRTPIVAENAAAYEAYRQRLEERFSTAQREVDPQFASQENHSAPPLLPPRPTYAHGMVGHQQKPHQQQPKFGFSSFALSLIALTACGLGGGVGYLGANPDMASKLMSNSLVSLGSLWASAPSPVSETVIVKKTIQTAKLEVNDAAGAVNTPIPLDISALPANAMTPIALRISGLPASAYLTKGVEISEGEWMLKASEIAQAELVVPHTDTSALALQVSALEESTGLPAAPSQDLKVELDMAAVPAPGVPQPKLQEAVIVPAAAAADQGFNKTELPTAVPIPLESMDPEVQSWMSKGEKLLGDGDVLAARQFFLRAYKKDTPSAAFGVGQTYDPAVYEKRNIRGLAPSAKLAAEWYGKAAATGNEAAIAALEALPVQP